MTCDLVIKISPVIALRVELLSEYFWLVNFRKGVNFVDAELIDLRAQKQSSDDIENRLAFYDPQTFLDQQKCMDLAVALLGDKPVEYRYDNVRDDGLLNDLDCLYCPKSD